MGTVLGQLLRKILLEAFRSHDNFIQRRCRLRRCRLRRCRLRRCRLRWCGKGNRRGENAGADDDGEVLDRGQPGFSLSRHNSLLSLMTSISSNRFHRYMKYDAAQAAANNPMMANPSALKCSARLLAI